MKNIIASVIILVLTIINIIGVNTTKILSNLITVSKLVPLIAFIVIGIFFVNGSHFTPVFPEGEYQGGTFASAAILLFFVPTSRDANSEQTENTFRVATNLRCIDDGCYRQRLSVN